MFESPGLRRLGRLPFFSTPYLLPLPKHPLQATYQFHPDTGEAEVWLHGDDSCLSTLKQGRFVAHTRQQQQPGGGPPQEQLYAAHCVPESVWGCDGRYALASMAAHAVKFRYAASPAV